MFRWEQFAGLGDGLEQCVKGSGFKPSQVSLEFGVSHFNWVQVGTIPGWQVLPELGSGPPPSDRRHTLVHLEVHEYDPAIRGSNPKSRRRVKQKVRKIFDTTQN